jgi:hypothetical protein
MKSPATSPNKFNLLPASDHQEYDLIRQSLLRKNAPLNREETGLVESLAYEVWTSRRMVRLRTQYPFETAGSALMKMTERRLAAAARNYTRALKFLNQLRKDRRAAKPTKPVQQPVSRRRHCAALRTASGEWIN